LTLLWSSVNIHAFSGALVPLEVLPSYVPVALTRISKALEPTSELHGDDTVPEALAFNKLKL
jgi:hypothetical protein